MKLWHIKTGKGTLKINAVNRRGAMEKYYGSSHHFKTGANIISINPSKPKVNRIKKQNNTSWLFR